MTAPVTLGGENRVYQNQVQEGNLNRKSVVVLEKTKTSDFVAGFDGLSGYPSLRGFVTFAGVVTTLGATVAVGIATGALKTTAITFLACGALTLIASVVTPQ